MQVEYRLAGFLALIRDDTVPLAGDPLYFGYLVTCKAKMSDELSIAFTRVSNVGDVLSGNDEDMHGSDGIEIFKCDAKVVLVDKLRWDLS